MLLPERDGFAHFVQIHVPIINRCNRADLATGLNGAELVVEQALDDMRRNPQRG